MSENKPVELTENDCRANQQQTSVHVISIEVLSDSHVWLPMIRIPVIENNDDPETTASSLATNLSFKIRDSYESSFLVESPNCNETLVFRPSDYLAVKVVID